MKKPTKPIPKREKSNDDGYEELTFFMTREEIERLKVLEEKYGKILLRGEEKCKNSEQRSR